MTTLAYTNLDTGSTSDLVASEPVPERGAMPGGQVAQGGWATSCSNGTAVLLWSPSNGRFFRVAARCQRLTTCSGCRAIMAGRQVDVIVRACQEPCQRCGQQGAAQLYVGRATPQEWKAARERRNRLQRAGGVDRPRGRAPKNDVNSSLWGTGSVADCAHGVESIKVAHRDDERVFVASTHDLAPAARRGGLQAVGLFTPYAQRDALEMLRRDLGRSDYARRDCTERWRIRGRNWRITTAKDSALAEAMEAVGVEEGRAYSKEEIAVLSQRIKEHLALAQGGEAP